MEKDTILGSFEKAMCITKASMNSNFFNRFDQTTDMDHVRTLYDYAKNDPEVGIDAKEDEQLMKYYVVTVEDTEGISADGKIDIILDPTGHDVAIRYVDVNSNQMRLDISPKILENNAELLGKLKLGIDKTPEEVAKMIAPSNLKELVDDLERNGSIAYASKEDALDRTKDFDSKKVKEEDKVNAEEDPENSLDDSRKKELIEAEAKESDDIPDELLSEVVRICMENDMSPKNLKQSLRFENPEILLDDMDNQKTRINPNGGAVLVLRFRDSGVEGKDKIIMAQKGQTLPYDGSNDKRISEMMENHKGNNITVAHDYDDGHEDDIVNRVSEALTEMQEEMELNAKNINAMDGEPEVKLAYIKAENSKISAEYEDKIVDMVSEEFPCREALKQADLARENTQEIEETANEIEEEKIEENNADEEKTNDDDSPYDELGRRKKDPRYWG